MMASTASGPAPRERSGPGTGSEPHADQTVPDGGMSPAIEERTRVPGIFKRGTRYTFRVRDRRGKIRRGSARTLAEARAKRAAMATDVERGEYRDHSRATFAAYATEWMESYRGRTSKGIRPATLDDYKRSLKHDAIPFLGAMRLAEIEPRDVRAFAQHVSKRGVSANTVRLSLAAVKVVLATA